MTILSVYLVSVSVAPESVESVVLHYRGREVAGGQHSLTVICMTRNSILRDTAITSGLQINMTERWRSQSQLELGDRA